MKNKIIVVFKNQKKKILIFFLCALTISVSIKNIDFIIGNTIKRSMDLTSYKITTSDLNIFSDLIEINQFLKFETKIKKNCKSIILPFKKINWITIESGNFLYIGTLPSFLNPEMIHVGLVGLEEIKKRKLYQILINKDPFTFINMLKSEFCFIVNEKKSQLIYERFEKIRYLYDYKSQRDLFDISNLKEIFYLLNNKKIFENDSYELYSIE